MRILGIDTASRTCSVAVCHDDTIRAEITDGSGETHSRHLMALVDRALAMAGEELRAMDALAVNRGPGSFTGVRIGISTAKGLAAGAALPLVGVSGLEALAWQAAPTRRLICPLLDARRREVYTARYRFAKGELVCLAPETVCAPEDAVRDMEGPCVLIGDGVSVYADRLSAVLGDAFRVAPPFQHYVRAGAIAFAARPRIASAANDLMQLVPMYLRPSYAQEPVDKSGKNRY